MADDGQVTVIMKALDAFTERFMKKLTFDITANLIEVTPVDTGWARANWVPQITTPYSPFIPELDREERQGFVGGAQAEQGAALQTIPGYKIIDGPIYISNNVPYINSLNDGSSSKAPAAFVQASIEKGIMQSSGSATISVE